MTWGEVAAWFDEHPNERLPKEMLPTGVSVMIGFVDDGILHVRAKIEPPPLDLVVIHQTISTHGEPT